MGPVSLFAALRLYKTTLKSAAFYIYSFLFLQEAALAFSKIFNARYFGRGTYFNPMDKKTFDQIVLSRVEFYPDGTAAYFGWTMEDVLNAPLRMNPKLADDQTNLQVDHQPCQ